MLKRKPIIDEDELRKLTEEMSMGVPEKEEEFAVKIFHFMCYYMVGAFAIVFLVGVECNRFHLSDSVLLMLLGTTTANVIGVFNFVAKYLFNKDK